MKFNETGKKLNDFYQKELEDIQQKINNGEKTSKNYFSAYLMCSALNIDGNSDKKMIEHFANLTITSSKEDIQMNRDVDKAYYQLAKIYYDKKEKTNGFFCINKAIELNPNSGESYMLRAKMYKDTGKNEIESRRDYDRAKELSPEYSECINMIKNLDREDDVSISKFEIFLTLLIIIILILLDLWL